MNKFTRRTMVKRFEEFGREFLKENYGIELGIPIKINARLSRALGRFVHEADGNSLEIDLSKSLIEYNEPEFVEDVLKHELIHYALYELGKPYRDGDSYFETEIKKHGATSNRVHIENYARKTYIYNCGCGMVFKRERKDGHNYMCGRCNGSLKFKRVNNPKKRIEII